jgi:hypothetical protein
MRQQVTRRSLTTLLLTFLHSSSGKSTIHSPSTTLQCSSAYSHISLKVLFLTFNLLV